MKFTNQDVCNMIVDTIDFNSAILEFFLNNYEFSLKY